jgi:uncharacterized membrane protein
MIIHVSPDAPVLIRAAAAAALTLHIGGGVLGIAAGGGALAFRKGGRLHRLSGDVFAVAMLVSMTVGAITAPLLPQPANTPGALVVAYLVVSAWATVRRRPGEVGRLEIAAAAAPLLAAIGLVAYGWIGSHNARAPIDAGPFQAAAVSSIVCAAIAALDLQMVRRRRLTGAARIARHIWRMCAVLFAATGSLFIGQPQVFPPPLHGSPILFLPVVATVAAMIFWLVRVRSPVALRHILTRAPA